jgi:hypothetical protein
MTLASRLLLAAVSAAALTCSMPADAQWAWRDAAGKMVYSDQPPPKSIPAKDVVRQPAAPAVSRQGAAVPAQGGELPSAEAKTSPARAGAPSVAERDIESRRRQQQLAESEKNAADAEARRVQEAENCERLRAYQRALEGGHRIARINAAGEKEILGDATRTAEIERTRAQIEQRCR